MNKENIGTANINTGNKAALLKIRKQNSQYVKAVKEESQKIIQTIKQAHKQQICKLKHNYEELLKDKQDYIRMLETLVYSNRADQKYQELKQEKIKISSLLNSQTIILHQTLDIKQLGRSSYYDTNQQQNRLMNTHSFGSSQSKINSKRAKSKHRIQPAPKIDYRKIL